MVLVRFYTALCPVLATFQSAVHFTTGRPVLFNANSVSLLEELSLGNLPELLAIKRTRVQVDHATVLKHGQFCSPYIDETSKRHWAFYLVSTWCTADYHILHIRPAQGVKV